MTSNSKSTEEKIYVTIILLMALFLTNSVCAQTIVKDYMSVPGPILFDSVSYGLSWSAHPSDHYFKQEYFQKGDDLEKFTRVILVEFVVGDLGVKDEVDLKVSELRQLPIKSLMYYSILDNKKSGEYMLDFTRRQNAPDSQHVSIVERNVYHFKATQDAAGRKGVLLFGVITRAYGDDIDKFLAILKTNKNKIIHAVLIYGFPSIKIVE